MQKFKQSLAVKALAWVLAVAITVTMTPMPFAAFAEPTPPSGTSTRDAEGDIASGTIANDAPNAVHAFVGVQTGGDANLPLANATGQEFQPIQGVKAYFQWFEDGGYVSPVYSAVSDANGRLNIDCKPYVASDGKIIKFDADPTVSGGHEKYRFWVDHSTIPAEYQLQYITGEQVVFPPGIATITQGGSGSNTAKNTHENWKILLMQKPKAEMHKTATPTQAEANGGYIKGKVSWDYNSPAGGVQWKYIAHQTTPAEGVTVKASYLSDYAMKKIYSDDMAVKLSLSDPSAIRGKGWTSKLEGQLQDEIKKQMKGEEDKWIAETVTAVTNAEGDYTLQFNGTWGYKQNADVAKGYDEVAGKFGWTQPALDRLGTVATNASDGSFKDAALNYNEKHINLDWLFVSTEGTEDLRVMTPYNNNWYTAMNSDWGIHSGWSGASVAKEFSVGVTNIANRSMKSDFVFGINKVNFNITNYDSRANTAIPGDVAETSTTGLPYSNTSDKYRIVWYDQDGNEVKTGPSAQPSSTGTLPSCPLDTETDIPGGVTKTTEFTAKLYRVDSKGNNAELIAGDSFTVEVSHLFISRYDEVNLPNPKANDPEMKDANYSATGLPQDLTIASNDGTISGKAKKAGLYKATFTTILSDKDAGEIKGIRERYIAVTDSPLAAGEVGKAYSQAVKPVPEKDPKDRAYVYKVKSVNFINGKEVAGLSVTGNETDGFTISGTPTVAAAATEEAPNVQVTYDIYKTNDQGKEILVKTGHVDKVPLVVKAAQQASSYIPDYKAVNGKVGEEATVAAPTFKDAEGNPATPTGVTYKLAEGYTGTAEIDANTGAITYTPVEADADKAVEIPVVVKYADGSTDDAKAVINVTKNATTADKVRDLGGLNPQTIKVWKSDTFEWKDGVVPTNDKNSDAVYKLLEEAKITDTAKPERDSQTSGKKSGTLLVTFEDGSTIEVPNQMLIVSDHVVVIDPNNTDPDAIKEEDLPSGNVKVLFEPVRNGGVASITTTGTTYAKVGTVLEDKDFPSGNDITYQDDYKKEVTWKPAKTTAVKNSGPGFVKGKGFVFRASATLPDVIDRTDDPTKPTPDGYVRVTFTNGNGVNDIENNKVYDVKEGTALTADKYPTVTPKDGFENPVWSVEAGTAITKDTQVPITATATEKTPEYTDDDFIPWVPGTEDEPTKGTDGKDIPDNYITVTFKS
ncbi:MAG: Rib/alpha-like domain-containing protein [Peptococcus niger]